MLIAFTGCDGSGKSTQIVRIRDWLRSVRYDADIVNKWDILDPLRWPECRFIRTDLEDLRVCIAQMEGPARALFLFWSIFLTLSRSDLRSPAKIHLVDGYWMKHAAAELEYGCDEALIEAAIRSFPPADLVFYFDVAPEEALRRKPELTPYECGRDATLSPLSFLHHQTRVRRRMQSWIDRFGWVAVDSAPPADEVTGALRDHLEPLLRRLSRHR